MGREEEDLAVHEAPAPVRSGPRVLQPPASPVVPVPVPVPSVVPPVVPADTVPVPIPAVVVRGEGAGTPFPAQDLDFPPLTGTSSFSSSQDTPGVLEKRRTVDSPGGVDGATGEEGATGSAVGG